VTFVTVDGDPVIGCVMTYDSSAENGPARKQNRQAFLAGVHQEVRQLHARRAQADPLAALTQASAAAGPGGTVVLMDSGLQTVAPLDFAREDLLDADPATVVAQLRADGELPHLGGQSVILDGIGYTASPQARLDEDQRDHLIVLWRQIVHAGGAAHVQDINTPDTSAADQKLPPVSLVRVPPPNDVALGCNQRTDLSNDGAVGFLPGQTAFRDPASARPVLLRIAQWLRRNPSARAELTGSIAHYGAGGPGGLSAARAQRIKLALISLGAGHGQVTATGIGWGPFPTRASPPDPASDELNRRVVVELTCD
jgi:outer membrane protein OmpA-like peptidoglycan-associated protein